MNAPARTWVDNVSWLDDLPEGWEATTVRRVTTFRDIRNGGHDDRLLSLSAYTGVRDKELDDENRARTGEDLAKYWQVEPTLLVVNPMWLNHGSVAVSDVSGVISPDYRVYELRDDLLPRFAHYVFRSSVYRSLYGVLTRGHTTYDRRISKDDFASLPFAVPPMAYQRAIANFLDEKTAAIDALIEKKERLIALLAEKRAALIHQAVTKGLDSTVPMKPSGIPWIGDIPAHWSVSALRWIRKPGTAITYGIVQAGPDVPGGIPYIRVSEMSGRELPREGYQRTSPEIDRSYRRSKVFAGDLVVAIRASIGKTLRVPSWLDGANLTQGTAKVSVCEDVSSSYVFWVMNSEATSAALGAASKGATFKEITLETLRKLQFALPPRAEQEEVVSFLRREAGKLDSCAERIESQVLRLQEYRQALITAAVTSQLDIPGAAA